MIVNHFSLFQDGFRPPLIVQESIDHVVVLPGQDIGQLLRLFLEEVDSDLHGNRLHIFDLQVEVNLVLMYLLLHVQLHLLVSDLHEAALRSTCIKRGDETQLALLLVKVDHVHALEDRWYAGGTP